MKKHSEENRSDKIREVSFGSALFDVEEKAADALGNEEMPADAEVEDPGYGMSSGTEDYLPAEQMPEASAEESEEETGEETEEVSKEDKSKKILKEVLDWVKTVAIGVIVGVLLVTFVIQRDNVQGDSMLPTLKDGYAVFTEKISTYFDNFDRGDIVILDGHGMEGYNHEECLIKRVIALPGETIRIEGGKVYIKEVGASDFKELDEPYLNPGVITEMRASGMAKGYNEVTLGEKEYYCMGDNRPVSNDSRNLGPFSSDRIKGVAIVVVYPFSEFKFL